MNLVEWIGSLAKKKRPFLGTTWDIGDKVVPSPNELNKLKKLLRTHCDRGIFQLNWYYKI